MICCTTKVSASCDMLQYKSCSILWYAILQKLQYSVICGTTKVAASCDMLHYKSYSILWYAVLQKLQYSVICGTTKVTVYCDILHYKSCSILWYVALQKLQHSMTYRLQNLRCPVVKWAINYFKRMFKQTLYSEQHFTKSNWVTEKFLPFKQTGYIVEYFSLNYVFPLLLYPEKWLGGALKLDDYFSISNCLWASHDTWFVSVFTTETPRALFSWVLLPENTLFERIVLFILLIGPETDNWHQRVFWPVSCWGAAISRLSQVIYGVYEVRKFTDTKKLLRQIFGDKRQEVTEEQRKTT